MSEEFEYEDNTPSDKEEIPSSNTNGVQDQINDLVSAMVEDENGKWEIPKDKLKGVSEAVVYAAKAEKRFRDTQSSYTKSRQRVKELETVNDNLTEHVIQNATMHLTDQEREELDDLRTSNPEAWREKLNEHEQKAKELQNQKIEEFKNKGKEASEGEMRTAAYQAFTERTGIELSDDVINNQLPASFMKNIEEGKWTFDKFLDEAEKFLKLPAKIKGANDKPENDKDLSKMPGGKEPSEEAQEGDAVQSYKNEVY